MGHWWSRRNANPEWESSWPKVDHRSTEVGTTIAWSVPRRHSTKLFRASRVSLLQCDLFPHETRIQPSHRRRESQESQQTHHYLRNLNAHRVRGTQRQQRSDRRLRVFNWLCNPKHIQLLRHLTSYQDRHSMCHDKMRYETRKKVICVTSDSGAQR